MHSFINNNPLRSTKSPVIKKLFVYFACARRYGS